MVVSVSIKTLNTKISMTSTEISMQIEMCELKLVAIMDNLYTELLHNHGLSIASKTSSVPTFIEYLYNFHCSKITFYNIHGIFVWHGVHHSYSRTYALSLAVSLSMSLCA